jgi:hypothetical protein
VQDKKTGNEVATIDASRPPEGWEFSAWREFLTGLAPLLANESDAKWVVGDYLVSRIGSGDRTPDYHNGRDAVLRETARVFLLSEHTLRDRYRTSATFAPEDRVFDVAWTVYRQFAVQDNSVLALREFVSQGGTSKREAAKHLGTSEGNVGAPLIARSLERDPQKVADLVSQLPQATRDELVKQAVKADPIATIKAVNESEHVKQAEKKIARDKKALLAKKASDKAADKVPLTMAMLAGFMFDVQPFIETLTERAQKNGVENDETAAVAKAVAEETINLLNTLVAAVGGQLAPLPQDQFDAAIATLLAGGGENK